MAILGAVKGNKGGPPELGDFRIREQFWTRFGMRLDELDQWPRQQIDDYITIMQAEAAASNEQSGQSTHSVDDTERAYQAMKMQQAELAAGTGG